MSRNQTWNASTVGQFGTSITNKKYSVEDVCVYDIIIKSRKESTECKQNYTTFFEVREKSCRHLFQ